MPGSRPPAPPGSSPPGSSPPHAKLASAGAGLGAAAFVGWPGGLLLGPVVSLLAWWVLRQFEPASVRRERLALAADVPLVCELIAAALGAGLPVQAATGLVGECLPGGLGARCSAAARMLRLGADPVVAWAGLRDVPGGPPLGRALTRAGDDGLAGADVLRRLAAEYRQSARAEALARTQGLGVRAAAPLGLCLLPAFVLVGVVPVVAAGLMGLGW